MIFLIRYDRLAGKVVEIREFAEQERQKADNARLEMEIALVSEEIRHEIILLQAESQSALRKTHNRYFANFDELTGTKI